MSHSTPRLRHGYTNGTSMADGVVTKRYLGPDAGRRHRAEALALGRLAGVLPVPPLVADGADHIVTAFVPGTHGQELLDGGRAGEVLHLCGRLARRVRSVDPALLPELGEPAPGHTLVHGDFGPQNLIVDPQRWEPAALIDWELVRFGDPAEDVAWTEWIVRTHHPDLVPALGALFDGYGERPPWSRRHAAMLRTCHWALDLVRRWEPVEGTAEQMWLDRLARTETYRDLGDG